MREREIELLYSYYLNNLSLLEGDLITYRNNIRYRPIDHVDCLEMLLLLERKATFEHTMKNVFELLKIRTCDCEEEGETLGRR